MLKEIDKNIKYLIDHANYNQIQNHQKLIHLNQTTLERYYRPSAPMLLYSILFHDYLNSVG